MVSGSSNLLHNWEWSDGFWSKFQSGKLEGEVMHIKVDGVPGLVMVGFLDVQVVSVLVLVLSL